MKQKICQQQNQVIAVPLRHKPKVNVSSLKNWIALSINLRDHHIKTSQTSQGQ